MSTSIELLREHLRADARARETSVLRVERIVALVLCAFVAAIQPLIGTRLVLCMLAMFGTVIAYWTVMLLRMRRGWYRPWAAWANVVIEISTPLAALVMQAEVKGGVYAATASPPILWGAVIMLSAMRASRLLCIVSGALAAVEYLCFHILMVLPVLPPGGVVVVPARELGTTLRITTLSLPAGLQRGLMLLAGGLFASVVASYLVQRAEEALRAVRAQDLMSKYFLHERLGAGGMAEVFRATYSPEGGFERTVAIKRILPARNADRRFAAMFRDEARICAMLHHPNIVQVYDVGLYEGTYVLAMEYVDGISLDRVIAAGARLELSALAYLAVELASALDYVHGRVDQSGRPVGLVHRDVTPSNILLSRIGEVKLADFGVAQAAIQSEQERDGTVCGKFPYMAPEQMLGLPVDGRTDLYALGVTLHEALCGRGRDAGRTEGVTRMTREAARASVETQRPRPSELRSDAPLALDQMIMHLLERDPAKRPRSAREVRQALLQWAGPLAPYPDGQAALVRAVEAAREVQPPRPAAARVAV